MNYYGMKQYLLNTFIGPLYSKTIGRLRRRGKQLRVKNGMSNTDFLIMLTDKNVDYALIRSIENINSARDIDIIVSDRDLTILRCICAKGIFAFGKPVDAFSVNGAKGHNFKTIAYFPPKLSRAMLKRSVEIDGIKTLSLEDEFHALLYHLIYHKDILKNLNDIFLSNLNDKYLNRILFLSEKLGCNLEGKSVHDIFQLLDNNGWDTPFDAINKLSNFFPVVRQYRELKIQQLGQVNIESCLILRAGYPIDDFKKILFNLEKTYEIVLGSSLALTDDQINNVKQNFRGGNWSNLGKTFDEGGGPIFIQFIRPNPSSEIDIHVAVNRLKLEMRNKMGGNYVHSGDDDYETAQLRKMLNL